MPPQNKKLTRRFLLAALMGVLFFSWGHGALIAHADVEVTSTAVQGLWHFASSSSTKDSSSNNWALDGSAVPNTTSSFVSTGLHDSFDDSTHQYVYTSASPNFNTNFSSFSVFSWIKTSNTASRIFSDASQDSIVLYLTGSKVACQVFIQGVGAKSTTGSTVVNNNVKHNVGCVWDGSASGTLYIYVDGSQDASLGNTGTGSLRNGASAIFIGEGAGNSEQFTGGIDEVLLTNTALSTSIISSLYNGGNGAEVCTTAGCGNPVITVSISPSSSLQQYKSDGTSTIAEGGTTSETTVKFGATVQTNGSNNVQLQVELKPFNKSFTGAFNVSSTYVASGTQALASTSSLLNGLYKWQARAANASSVYSAPWQTLSSPAASYDFIVNTSPGPAVYIASSSVQALWHLDNSIQGSVYDSSPNGWDLDGSSTPSTTSSFVSTGLHESFDDTTHQYVYTSTSTNFNTNFQNFSIFSWIKTTLTQYRIFSDANQDSIVLYLSGGKIACQVYATVGGATGLTGNKAVNDNLKHNVGCTWNGTTGTLTIYVDGVQDATVTAGTGSLRNGASNLYVGEGVGNSEPFTGLIDEMVLTNTVLSSSTASNLYNGGFGATVCITLGCQTSNILSGNITASSTWTLLNSPYIVTSTVTINSGVQVDVAPGVIVKMKDNTDLVVSGNLNVEGTSSTLVYFTSYHDDSVGGDTNGDGTSTLPAAGNWGSIQMNAGASTTLAGTVVRYGGSNASGNNASSTLYNSGTLYMHYADVSYAKRYGLYAASGTSTVDYSDIHDNDTAIGVASGTVTVAA